MPTRKTVTPPPRTRAGRSTRSAAAPAPEPVPDDASAARVAEILDAALQVLQQRGFRDTTMLEVATVARASKNTLYQHFPTKVALFEALVARSTADLHADVAAALDAALPVESALQRYGEAWLRMAGSAASLAIQRAAIGEAPTAPELGQALGRSADGARPPALRYLRERMRDGLLQKADPADALDAFAGLLFGDAPVQWLAGHASAPSDADRRRRAKLAARRFIQVFGT
jgi:AcrR family transcriptional regulator